MSTQHSNHSAVAREPAESAILDDRSRELSTRQPVKLHPLIREPQVLIVCGDRDLAANLISALGKSGLAAEHVTTMTAGCVLAESGYYEAVLSEPKLPDGTWKRLAQIARRNRSPFAVILIAKTFDLSQWVRALEEGAFDVIDVVSDLPQAGEVVKRALWVEYLSGDIPGAEPPLH